jgi:hypothetical protein
MIIRLLELGTVHSPVSVAGFAGIESGDIFRASERRYFALFRLSDLWKTGNSSSWLAYSA